MSKTPFISALWLLFQGLAVVFLILAVAPEGSLTALSETELQIFGAFSTLIFSMFASIFALLALSFSLNTSIGRPLTLYTAAVSSLLLMVTTVLLQLNLPAAGWSTKVVNLPAQVAAILMILRAFGVVLLPPRGDIRGCREASCACVLATVLAALSWFRDPLHFPAVFSGALLLSWPLLIDGINAFADKIFHSAALAAGARDFNSKTFSKIAQARNIVLDKAAVMSGPDLIVTNVIAFNNDPGTLLAVAASAEAQSSHPVAEALCHLAAQWQIPVKAPDRFQSTPGLGVVALLGGQTVVIGTTDLLKKLKIDSFTADAIARSLEADGKTVLRVAVAGRVVGVFGLEGTLRQDAGVAATALRAEGLEPWLHTGDSPKTRAALAGMLGLKVPDTPKPGETALEATSRLFCAEPALVLSLSPDRTTLELRDCCSDPSTSDLLAREPIAVCNTDDIGVFPALKALAMRRNRLALRVRRLLVGLWVFSGICGAIAIMPLAAAPLLFLISLVTLWTFARFSVTDTLSKVSRAPQSQMLELN